MLRSGKQGEGAVASKLFGTQGSTNKADYRHPFYWAAFIQSGEWRGMSYDTQAR
jgi:CHAT domain-containing protein